jgi:hypothetical protein
MIGLGNGEGVTRRLVLSSTLLNHDEGFANAK